MMMKNEQEEQRIGIDEEIHEERYEQRRKNVFLPYDELRIIFRYLNAMDLLSAAMVCRYEVFVIYFISTEYITYIILNT